MKQNCLNLKKSPYITVISMCIALILILLFVGFFTPYSRCDEDRFVNIDADDNLDSVLAKVDTIGKRYTYSGFCMLARHSNFDEKIHTGHYVIKPGTLTFSVFRMIKNGNQTPVRITIPPVRTIDRLAEELSKKMMVKSSELTGLLTDEAFCEKYDMDTCTVISLFIPNTYEFFWDMPAEKLVERMQKEYDTFWNDERKSKAEALKMTPVEVMTLASIIDEETANNGEKPRVAGMYYNRLKVGMPLQADPTIKFAMKNFDARRIYHSWLTYDSPYNTYKNAGLPPGPIRIPSIAGIDAVLNLELHNYLYMCAKEDFSGTHNFATTYAEHQRNAQKYSKALNERGIK